MSDRCYILMGVCGCGKSTIGARLAARSGGAFLDGDAFHPDENVAKMSAGSPLDDTDRRGWLLAIRAAIDAHPGPWPLFFGCSALKRSYRDMLRGGERGADVRFIHLSGSRQLLEERMNAREGHFMKPGMLDSQFEDLEPLAGDEPGFAIDITPGPETLVGELMAKSGFGAELG